MYPRHLTSTRSAVSVAALLVLLSPAAGASVNKSIRIDDGRSVDRNVSSVNGSVTIGRGAEVRGKVSSVNGSVDVRSEARVGDVSSVNGGIDIDADVVVDGDVESVNGGIRTSSGTSIAGHVETVNGGIDLEGTEVGRDVATVNGDIELERGTRVAGDVVVEENRGRRGWWNGRQKPLRIELSGNSVVEGDIDVLDEDREVVVILRDGSTVRGEIRGAEVERR